MSIASFPLPKKQSLVGTEALGPKAESSSQSYQYYLSHLVNYAKS
jgi:hypothetical protein